MVDGSATPGAVAPRWWSGLVRRKKHISSLALTALTAAACVPLLLAFSRILALPWGESLLLPGVGFLRTVGGFLNQNFTLEWVPPGDRAAILYLLLLPTGALLVAVARLTFGIRVLGLRAILIAIGFQAAGLLPSLVLMTVVVGAIVLIRPWIRRVRLPLYARITVILCLAAMIMLGALLVAPWLGSEAVWSVAFFPVIIMAMLAEGVAKTLEQDDVVMAVWRAGWTIIIALLIALIDSAASRFSYQFPELILTQVIAIVFVAEFLDLRLLEEWPARLSRYFAGKRPWYRAKPKVAVVRNRDTAGVIGQLGRAAPGIHRKQSVQRHVDALREQGFAVKVLEGDIKLLSELSRFMPPAPGRGTPGGIVLNLATGVQGEGRFCHVPAMLEMAGIPYTGPDPLAHARLADRFALMTLLAQSTIPVPRHLLVHEVPDVIDIEFPGAARPRFEPDANRIVVRHRSQLRNAVREIRSAYGQPTVLEEIVDGRRISVAVIGNDTCDCLPLVELSREGAKACPAPLGQVTSNQVCDLARAAFRAAGCRDYARIDVRLPQSNNPVVIDVKWLDLFARRGSFVIAAEAAGYTFATLMRRIVSEAAKRYIVRANTVRVPTEVTPVVSLAKRRAAVG